MDDDVVRACDECRDPACHGCEAFRVTGSVDAAAGCVVRLTDLGWRFRSEQVEVAPSVWEARVTRPSVLV